MSHNNELTVTRQINAPRNIVWRCWTEPTLLKQWYCPKPWKVTQAEIDLRPGGRMNTVLEGPSGEKHDKKGVFLEIVPMERLIFTDAFTEGFIPQEKPFMVGVMYLSDDIAEGTTMQWSARHWSAEDMARHENMGFHDGWSAAAAQLADLARHIAAEAAG